MKLFFFLYLNICIIFLNSCMQFGENPKGKHLEIIKDSPNYSVEDEKFVNRKEIINLGFWDDPAAWFSNNMILNFNETVPKEVLPEIKPPDIYQFLEPTDSIKFIWFGHSTLLINIQNTIILVDPVFSKSASPVNFIVPRFQPPVLEINKLPNIDYILISHDHYDHLDMKTIKFFNNNKDISFVVPLGVGSHLKKWGVENSRITEMDWWDTKIIKGIKFICTPAQHFSGRKAFIETQKSLWASWVVKSGKRSFYFSGDSGYAKHYKQIGDKYGPMEVVFMDSGQYNTRWREVHNMPEEVIKGFIDLKGENLIPIHWGMFTLAMHNWFDPPVEIKKRAEEKSISLITPIIGQVIDMKNLIDTESWWEKFINVIK